MASSHARLSQFIDRLVIHARCRIVVCNLLSGIEEELFDVAFIKELLDWWLDLFSWRLQQRNINKLSRAREGKELIDTLDLLVFEPKPKGFRPGDSKPDFRLKCKIASRSESKVNGYGYVTHALTFQSLIAHEEGRRVLAGTAPGIPLGDLTEDEQVALAENPGALKTIRLRDGATIGKPTGLFWVTLWDEIQANLNHPKPANQIRDLLGLIHYVSGDRLLTLHIPNSAVEMEKSKTRSGRPTFADAGSHARFKGQADSSRHKAMKAWGFTVNLDKLARGHKILDGSPERVCLPIPTESFGDMSYIPLGKLDSTRGLSPNEGHGCYADRLCKGRDFNELARELLGILR